MKLLKVLLPLFACLFLFVAPSMATVPSSTTFVQYVLTSNPQTLAVPFVFQSGGDLLVLDSKTSPPVTLTQNSDYSVSGGAGSFGSISTIPGGANGVQVGDTITISRRVPLTQTVNFTNTGPLTASMIGQALDKQTEISQQINLRTLNSLQFQQDEVINGVLGKDARKNNVLGFDSNGNVIFVPGATAYTASNGVKLVGADFEADPTTMPTLNQSTTGNAGTATALQTARLINGVSFNGTADVTVPAAAGTLTGSSLAAGVTQASGLLGAAGGNFGSMAFQNASAVAITGGTITGLGLPVIGADAASKSYVDSVVSTGFTPRAGVQVATTANLTLSGEQTIDGVLTSASRILVKNQTLTQNNGVYVTAAGAWARATDSDTAAELKVGYFYFVSSGTTQAGTSWVIQTAPTVLGTDPVVFVQYSASQTYAAGTGLNLAGNVFNLNAALSGLAITGSTYNGTVGATTPSTGSFTTVAASGAITAATVNATTSLTSQSRIFITGAAGTNRELRGQTSGVSRWKLFLGNSDAESGTFTGSNIDLVATSNDGLTNVVALDINRASLLAAFSGTVNAAGGFNGTIGSTTAASGIFTNILANSNTNLRAIKGNFHETVNVKDWGATGDGVTNDTAAILAAKNNAISTSGNLYFPKGTYITDTIAMASAVGVAVYGDGIGVSVIRARTPSQVLNIDVASNHVTVRGLTFDGNCVTRTAGQQAVIFNGSQSSFCDNEIINSGEFAFYAGSGAAVSDLTVSNNYIHACYADGINFGNVQRGIIAKNTVDGSDDDCIAVGYIPAVGVSTNIVVANNICRARTDLGTTWGRGILFLRSTDCVAIGNEIDTIKQHGILIDNDGARCQRIRLIGNTVKNTCINSGHAIAVYGSTDCSLIANIVDNPASGNCIDIADWQNLTIQGGVLSQTANVFARGIHADESTGLSGPWAASWDRLKISGVHINMLGASTNSCVYLSPDSSITMNTLSVTGIISDQVNAGDYLTVATARVGTIAKIGNNVKLNAANTVTPAATTGVITVFNNN